RGDRKDPAPGSNGHCAGVPEQVHGPQSRHPTSPLPDLNAIAPTAKLSGKTTPAPRKVQKRVRGLLLPPKPRVTPLEEPRAERRQMGIRTLTPPALSPLLFSVYCFLLPWTSSD
ncbi:hypothetical protein M405DRAFT_846588, partial [Rhizopogon salebrosus TDB-379]